MPSCHVGAEADVLIASWIRSVAQKKCSGEDLCVVLPLAIVHPIQHLVVEVHEDIGDSLPRVFNGLLISRYIIY